MTYSINVNNIILDQLPYIHKTPTHIAWLESLFSQNQWLNNNMLDYINGVTYSYYNPTTSYSLNNIVIGDLYYSDNGVYQYIANTFSYSYGAALTTIISGYGIGGYNYNVGDIVALTGNNNIQNNCLIKVNTVTNQTGLSINVLTTIFGRISTTSLANGGSGWRVGDTFTVHGGFSLATGVVTGISGFLPTGPVTTYNITYDGTGYSAGYSYTCNVTPTLFGQIMQYSLLENGWGYNIGLYNTTAITGNGLNAQIYVLSIGGTPPPNSNYQNIWYKISDEFIGVDERSLYTGNRLSLEYNLNRYYNTNFRQPVGLTNSGGTHSDIYITDDVVQYSTFLMGGNNYNSSFMGGNTNSTAFLSPLYGSFYNNTNYTVWVPILKAATVYGGTTSIAAYVNKYNYFSLNFNIQTY